MYKRQEVDTPAVQHREPGLPGDRVVVATNYSEAAVAVEAPGPFRLGGRPGVSGAWADTPRGFQVECRIPLGEAAGRLGLQVIRSGGESAATYDGRPGALVYRRPAFERELAALRQPDASLSLVNSDGRLLASAPAAEAAADGDEPVAGLAGWIYGLALGTGPMDAPRSRADAGRIAGPQVDAALAGNPGQAWFGSGEEGRAVLSVAVPLRDGEKTVGAVVAEQDTRAILTLRDHALTRLLGLTLGASLAAGAVLLGFASVLSLRIRRLAAATEGVRDGGDLPAVLPGTDRDDELGDLARRFEELIGRAAEHNRYLETLGQKLSHELRTPIAVVRSSLENLEAESMPEGSAGYVLRARQGADRLAALVQALSAATRIEEALSVRDDRRVDLARLVRDLTAAYAGAHPGHRFRLDAPTSEVPVRGSPELLAQMVDKLVDNAVDFTEPGGTLRIMLITGDGRAGLAVENPGPSLPEGAGARLFERMVSARPDAGGTSPHLGLGLFIARIIARHHGGDIMAANVTGGVRFTVDLPLLEEPSNA